MTEIKDRGLNKKKQKNLVHLGLKSDMKSQHGGITKTEPMTRIKVTQTKWMTMTLTQEIMKMDYYGRGLHGIRKNA